MISTPSVYGFNEVKINLYLLIVSLTIYYTQTCTHIYTYIWETKFILNFYRPKVDSVT